MANYCITLIGGKGGVGTSVCTSNLAAAIYRETKSKTLILHLDLINPGDLGMLFGAKDLRTVIDLLPVAHKLHERSIGDYITRHKSGLYLLPAVNNIQQVGQFDFSRFEMLLKTLRKAFPFILIDVGSTFTQATVLALKNSSSSVLFTTPDILVINRSLQMIRNITTLQYPQEMLKVVINQYEGKGMINQSAIQTKLKKKILSTLPNAAEDIEHSIHQNLPIILADPKCSFAKSIENLSHVLFSSGALKKMSSLDLKVTGVPIVGFGQPMVSTGESNAFNAANESISDMEYDRLSDIRMQVHAKLIDALNLKGINITELSGKPEKLAELKDQTREVLAKIVQEHGGIQSIEERQRITKDVLDEALGLGPLEDILADTSISEVMVNRKDQIYIEQKGKLILTKSRFTSDKHLMAVIERIVAPIGRRIDEKTPMVDARLKDGSRVHAIIPPLSIQGPMVTIRKFGQDIVSYRKLVEMDAITKEMAMFLKSCIEARLNIIISGGTGTGKTTLLNILSSFIPNDERIITVEDAAELKLPQEHVGRLEARPANLQGEGEIPIRELVRNTLRMRPDRIIVGECRGAEALDMLQAMNTGHDGSLTTLHSNNPRDCIARLETLVMFAGMDLPSKAIREQVASAIDLIVQLNRFSDGSRKVTHITEVTGMEGQTVTLQDIFLYKQKGLDRNGKIIGKFKPSGLIPSFMDRFKEKGIRISTGLFGESGGKKND